MTAWAVFWVGTGLEGVGLLVAVVGFSQTWREFSTGGRFFGKDIERLQRARRAARRFVRSILRREQEAGPPPITATGKLGESVDVLRGVGYTGLPSLTNDPESFTAEVEARLGRLHGEVHALRWRLEDEAKARERADQHVLASLETQVASVEGLSRRIAVGGLRAQVFGWLCVVLGLAFTTLATALM